MAADTRQRILDTGLELFARKGRHATAITEIEELVGLKPGCGGFYRHFRSKDDLYVALVAQELAKVEPILPADPSWTPREAVAAYLARCLDALEKLAILTRMVSHEWASESTGGGSPVVEAAFAGHQFLWSPPVTTALSATPEESLLIIKSALVGYRLSVAFFREPLGGVEPDVFLDDLTSLLVAGD